MCSLCSLLGICSSPAFCHILLQICRSLLPPGPSTEQKKKKRLVQDSTRHYTTFMAVVSSSNFNSGTPIARGGGHSGTEGGRTLVTYFAEEGVFFEDLRMSAIL